MADHLQAIGALEDKICAATIPERLRVTLSPESLLSIYELCRVGQRNGGKVQHSYLAM
jgi:hypothetical protein